jgi:hypothetical protein
MLSSFRAAHHRGETATLQTAARAVGPDAGGLETGGVGAGSPEDGADMETQLRETES